MRPISLTGVGNQEPPGNTWDFWTGRGDGATTADKAVARWQFAARVLGGTLAHDSTFCRYADELGRAMNVHGVAVVASPIDVIRMHSLHSDVVRRYWPRASERQAIVSRFLSIAAHNADQRTYHLANAGGPVAYVLDSEPRGPYRGYAVRPDYEQTIERGALLVARRGAFRCLGCAEPLEQVRVPATGGDRTTYQRVDYCDRCSDEPRHAGLAASDLQAMSDALRDAARFVIR